MAERRGSGADDGRDSVEPGQQDDRFDVEEGEAGSGVPGDDAVTNEGTHPEGPTSVEHDSECANEPERPPETEAAAADVVEFPRGRSTANFGTDGGELPWSEESPLPDADATLAGGIAEADSSEDELAESVDLAQLRADDELLDMLGSAGGHSGSTGAGTDVEELLLAWRRDVDATPIDELVDVDSAAAAVEAGKPKRRRAGLRHLVPVASAAAVLMIAFTGVGLAARDAAPGDALWGVTQVLYSDRASSAAAASKAQSQLEMASQAWQEGREKAAETALHRAEEQLRTVDPGERRSDLRAAHASLSAKFERPPEPPGSSSSESETSSEQGSSVQETPGTSADDPPPSSEGTTTPTSPSEPSPTSDSERPPSSTGTTPSETGSPSTTRESDSGSGSDGTSSSRSD
ncbi:Anti-sigma-D factor RsdA to sigma factor binding region [Actinopolyspora xinjiangensis]|uniref:Anti-sigma-D factor RsdA to sigma factor binding region n=1 Tax=Actinopolyspora xinjiangensis TaxID=405564 RepID=A0A1H0QAG0_9ACTN|nr:anti-sigma-D factor RsdA [Actinopolyspora xinjiangensis]SDP13669.1 Anti-sigma-D factor RsdA to sigma factor binding region [Actinopolyspora xinjiangensis]